MKLLGSTENKITKDRNCENVHLEITEVVLVHCNIVNDYQKKFNNFVYICSK